MITNLHQIVLRMSKLGFYAILISQTMFMAIANESAAQRRLLNDLSIVLTRETSDERMLISVIEEVEASSDFRFAYRKSDIEGKYIQISGGEWNMLDLLTKISSEAKLSVNRENEVISLISIEEGQESYIEEIVNYFIVVSGTVTDEFGEPLPGATVQIKGTTTGSITDFDGKYSLEVSENDILVISYTGFVTQEIAIGDRTVIDISLETDVEALGEVVVVGYGTQRKSDLTSAIASVKAKDIANRVAPRLDEALQGQMAGVSVQQASGVPGAAPNIRIRGVGSINAGNTPLYVIDGFPVDDLNVIANLNMNDVESIEVLKDAASAAIYGSRGSNGVIMVTTKSGKSGDLVISINSFYGIQEGERFWEYLDGNQSGPLVAEQRTRLWIEEGGQATDPNDARPPNRRIDPQWISGNQPSYGGNDFVFQTAPIQNHSVSLSGGGENVTVFASLDYLRQDGIARGTNFERFSTRLKIESQLTDKLKVGINVSPSFAKTRDADTEGKDNSIDRILTLGPLIPLNNIQIFTDASGVPFTNNEYDLEYDLSLKFHSNKVLQFLHASQVTENPQILANAYLNYEFIEGLNFRSSIGVTYNGSHRTDKTPGFTNNGVGLLYRRNRTGTNWLSENTLNYSKQINKHSFSILAGYTAQMESNQSVWINAQDLSNDIALTLGNASTITDWGESINEWSLLSSLARVTYDYNDKYFLTASIRRDGSSRFGTDTRWGTFSSFSGAWRISEEDFLNQNEYISNLKLRASWGQTGNNQIGNYAWIPSLNVASAPFGSEESPEPGLLPGEFGNDELSWEKTNATNLGIDLGLLDGRINISGEVYKNITTDMLFQVPIPSVTGFVSATQNVGKVENRGYEIEIQTFNMDGAFKWSTRANYSHNENEVLATNRNNSPLITGEWYAEVSYTGVGRPIGTFYMLEQVGIFQNQAEVDASAKFGIEGVGDVKVRDVDGNGVIDGDDRTFFGQPTPIWNFGITNDFAYKNFDLSIFINGAGGHQTFHAGGRLHDRVFANGNGKNHTANWANAWESEANPGDGRTPSYNSAATINQTVVTSRWLYDSDWIRIKNVTLGYTLPSQILNRFNLRSLRVYVTMDNLYLWTKYPGANPEGVGLRGGSASRSAGYDYGTYPLARRTVLGVNIGL